MNDQAKALLFVAAFFGGGGFTGGRVTAPAPPAEVRVVRLPSRPMPIPQPAVEAAPEVPAAAEPAVPLSPAEPLPPPPIAEEKPSVPVPAPRPKVETKAETKPKPHSKPMAPRPARKPTASECAQLKLGMLTIGKDGVITKAKARGYSSSQVAWAISACGL